MYIHFVKKIIFVLFFNSLILSADVGMQEGIYDAAEEMIAFDEKMNRLIAEHNQVDMEDEDKNIIEDFEETERGYVLKTTVDGNNTKVEVILKDRLLTVSMVTTEKQVIQIGAETSYESTVSSSSTSLYLPQDADAKSMKKYYENGILEVTFLKQ